MKETPTWTVRTLECGPPVPSIDHVTRLATDEPGGMLYRTSEAYAPGVENTARINATILSLVRNEEIEGMLQAMRDLERTWNHKFNYPWTFFNDVPFTDEFKRRTSEATRAETRYGNTWEWHELHGRGLTRVQN